MPPPLLNLPRFWNGKVSGAAAAAAAADFAVAAVAAGKCLDLFDVSDVLVHFWSVKSILEHLGSLLGGFGSLVDLRGAVGNLFGISVKIAVYMVTLLIYIE